MFRPGSAVTFFDGYSGFVERVVIEDDGRTQTTRVYVKMITGPVRERVITSRASQRSDNTEVA